MYKWTKLTALLTVLCLIATLFAGCQTGVTESETPTEVKAESAGIETETKGPADIAVETDSSEGYPLAAEGTIQKTIEGINIGRYPLVDEVQILTAFCGIGNELSGIIDSFDEIRGYQLIEEYSNVDIRWTNVPVSVFKEQFGLMVSSGDFTDIVPSIDANYSGGTAKAYADEVIIALNDYMEEYMPNYYAKWAAQENGLRDLINDDGYYLYVQGLSDDINVGQSLVIRQDWINELGLEKPKTFDQMTEVLKAFKTAYDISDPLLLMSSTVFDNEAFASGFNVTGFNLGGGMPSTPVFQIDGVIQNSLLSDGYRQLLTQYRDWYSEGLVNVDFYTRPGSPMSAEIMGLGYGGQAGILSIEISSIRDYPTMTDDPNFELTAINNPVVNEGDEIHLGISRSLGNAMTCSISTKCENILLACAFLDSLFVDWQDENGVNYLNWGEYGNTYVLDGDGNPTYTDLIINNPDGYATNATMKLYLGQHFPQYSVVTFSNWTDSMFEARELRLSDGDDYYALPSGLALTTAESEEYGNIFSDAWTFISETAIKYIVGDLDIDEHWDTVFIPTLKSLQVERITEIYQDALNRYNAR